MTLDSPILALCLLPVAMAAMAMAGRWLATGPRWVFRATVLLVLAAVAGPGVQCERELKIAVLVDVSPSTRGATFRDPSSVQARLTPLLAGRPYTVHYFADGLQPTPAEPAARRTRLEAPADADAIVLLSDGRFDRPANIPPTFVVVDPSLDAPNDARVRDIRPTEQGLSVEVVSTGVARPLAVNDTPAAAIPNGPATVLLATPASARATNRIGFAPGDRWPENDVMQGRLPSRAMRRWAIDLTLPGFERVSAARLVRGDLSLVDVSCIVMAADVTAAGSVSVVKNYVENLGGTLVLPGAPGAPPTELRTIAPLSPRPPDGPQEWVLLLDASGSMATADGRATRWAHALDAADSALGRMPEDARVSIVRFASDVRPIVQAVTPATARRALATAAAPSGRTGLRAALASVAAHNAATPVRVLLLTDGDADLGDVAVLAMALRQANVTVSAVIGTPSAGVSAVCQATGGTAVVGVAPAEWARALGGMAMTDVPVVANEPLDGKGPLAGQVISATRRWPAHAKADAELLLSARGAPAAASWNVGVGRVVSIAADIIPADLASLSARVERAASDPRFRVAFDSSSDRIEMLAGDAAGPMNGLTPTLSRDGRIFELPQVGPGQYARSLERSETATAITVRLKNAVVARAVLPGRYPTEFDAVGNDRVAVAELARTTNGALIEAGDHQPIAFAARFRRWQLQHALAAVGAAAGLVTILMVRRPHRQSLHSLPD